ncbi:MAG: malonyl-ACP O-methyltransferase BioC [Gammaproteobacteria bacterium]|nr:malonyl-ACP O-methyltransferase BioC [Gammaproteobacteria bacterium]
MTVNQDQRYRLDKRQVRDSFARAANIYDQAAVLQREVAQRMLERLDLVRLQPAVVLDVGAGTGIATAALAKRYKKARVAALDIALPMLMQARRRAPWFRKIHCVCADAEHPPFADACCDLIFSNLTLQWCNDLDKVLQALRRLLRPGGLLMFTTLGPDTLKELRESWAAVDRHSHVNAFLDMHDVGDALVRAWFADPVMDVERMTLTYRDARALMRDLKMLGSHNVTAGRPRALTGKGRLKAMIAAYERQRRDGVLPASYEVVYGHAWAPAADPATARVPLSTLRR